MANIDSNRIVKNTIFLYLRMFLSMTVSLYTVRVVLQTLSSEDYGIYSAVGGIILTFNVVANVLTNASQRFFSYEFGKSSNVSECKSLFSTIFFTYIALSLIVIIIAETVGLWFLQNKMTIPNGRESAAMWVFQFALISFVFSLLSNPFQAMIIAKERMGIYAYISITDVILKLAIVYFLVIFDYDQLKVYAVLVALVHMFINSIYVAFCIRISPEARFSKHVDKRSLKSVFSYSSWTLFGALTGMCNTQGVNLVLNVYWGPIANTAYAISTQVSSAVTSFAGNFALAIKPPLIKSYAAGDYTGVMKLFNFGTRITFLLMYMIILPIYINTPGILTMWLGNVGDYMVDFVRLTLVYSLIVTMSNPITNIVQASGRVKIYHGIVDLFTLISLPLTILLYQIGHNINYCYYVTIAIFSIAHVIRLFILKRVFSKFSLRHYIKSIIIPVVLIALSTAILMTYLKDLFGSSICGILLCCFASLALVVICCYVFLFTVSEKEYLHKIIISKLKK